MARTAAQIASIKNVKELYNLSPAEIRKLKADPEALRAVTAKMASAARKQIKRLEAAPLGSESPALVKLKNSGAKLTTRGSNAAQIADTFNALREFHGKKTATTTGWKKLQKQTYLRVNRYIEDADREAWTEQQQKRFWKAYRMASYTLNPQKGESDVVQQKMRAIQAGGAKKTIAEINEYYGKMLHLSAKQINAITKQNKYISEITESGRRKRFAVDVNDPDGLSHLFETWADVQMQKTGGLNFETEQKYKKYKGGQ